MPPAPVTIENSNIRSRNACIDVLGGGDITVRNTTGFGLNPEWETANTSPYGTTASSSSRSRSIGSS
jgi:hypothetical protein